MVGKEGAELDERMERKGRRKRRGMQGGAFPLGTCESAVCVRIESRIESAVGPRRGTARRTTAVGRYRGAPLTRDVGVGVGERRRGRGSQRRAARRQGCNNGSKVGVGGPQCRHRGSTPKS